MTAYGGWLMHSIQPVRQFCWLSAISRVYRKSGFTGRLSEKPMKDLRSIFKSLQRRERKNENERSLRGDPRDIPARASAEDKKTGGRADCRGIYTSGPSKSEADHPGRGRPPAERPASSCVAPRATRRHEVIDLAGICPRAWWRSSVEGNLPGGCAAGTSGYRRKVDTSKSLPCPKITIAKNSVTACPVWDIALIRNDRVNSRRAASYPWACPARTG